MKMIKNKSEIPNWFDINKYKKACELDISGWYENLYCRSSILNEWFDEFIRDKWWDEIINNGPVINKIKVYKTETQSVNRLTIFTFLHLVLSIHKFHDLSSLTNKLKSYSKKAVKFTNGKDTITDEEPIESILHPDWNYHSFLTLDTTYTDDRLIASFKETLKQIRIDANQHKLERWKSPYMDEPNMDEPNMDEPRKWVHYGVLPYLDLLIWSKKNNVSITNELLNVLIHGSRNIELTDDSIRNTTEKYSQMLITENSLKKMLHSMHSTMIITE